MITSIEIENLRGIASGKLEGLAPLTVLTGPNGCGKSTVLDAAYIATGPLFDGVPRVIARRPETRFGAQWLVGSGVRPLQAVVGARGPSVNAGVAIDFRWVGAVGSPTVTALIEASTQEPTDHERFMDGPAFEFDAANHAEIRDPGSDLRHLDGPSVIIDPGLPLPLHLAYSGVVRGGFKKEMNALFSVLIPDFREFEVLTEPDNSPALYVVTEKGAVPLSLAGDGIQAVAHVAFELARAAGGLALIEEPEVYQHPRALRQTAVAIHAAVARGTQVILTTHSLELIDQLIEVGAHHRDKMALFNLKLDGGKLLFSRWSGDDMAYAREQVGNDLR